MRSTGCAVKCKNKNRIQSIRYNRSTLRMRSRIWIIRSGHHQMRYETRMGERFTILRYVEQHTLLISDNFIFLADAFTHSILLGLRGVVKGMYDGNFLYANYMHAIFCMRSWCVLMILVTEGEQRRAPRRSIERKKCKPERKARMRKIGRKGTRFKSEQRMRLPTRTSLFFCVINYYR